MAVDIYAITVALAGRYDPAQITPPAGYGNIRSSNAFGPNGPAPAPFVVVNPPDSGRMTAGGQERSSVHTFTVDCYLEGAADLPRQLEAIARWLPILVDQTLTGLMLGGLVANTWCGRYETGVAEYAGTKLPLIRLFVDITTTDGITPTA